jgi:hypothetical protein
MMSMESDTNSPEIHDAHVQEYFESTKGQEAAKELLEGGIQEVKEKGVIVEEFGLVEEYQGVRTSIRVPRNRAKEIASQIITSNLPIDDILIDEMPIDDIIRVIFEAKSTA